MKTIIILIAAFFFIFNYDGETYAENSKKDIYTLKYSDGYEITIIPYKSVSILATQGLMYEYSSDDITTKKEFVSPSIFNAGTGFEITYSNGLRISDNKPILGLNAYTFALTTGIHFVPVGDTKFLTGYGGIESGIGYLYTSLCASYIAMFSTEQDLIHDAKYSEYKRDIDLNVPALKLSTGIKLPVTESYSITSCFDLFFVDHSNKGSFYYNYSKFGLIYTFY